MNTKLRLGYLAIALLCANWLSAQKSPANELISRADRQYDLYSYNLAIQTYQQALEEDKSNSHALARIGDCNYQLNHPEKSVEWYQKAQNTYNMEPDVPLRLGKALLQTGDYYGAKDQFLLYVDTDEKVGRHYANVADFAIKNAKNEAQWQIKNEAINTSAADYGAAFYFTRVAFNSARTDIVSKSKAVADFQGGNSNFVFVSQRNPESNLLQKPDFLRTDLQNNRNEGPVSFSGNGRRVAFCRNKFISGTRQIAEVGMNMSIYTADVEDGTWKNIKAFPFNGSSFATGFPSFSPDGSKLYFASTQPGGFGGWDIYVSTWTPTGWSEPRNLGTPLNTPGNEVTPFFDGDDLYFSSDWHNGFGGLDVFRTTMAQDEVSDIVHLGTGINSPKDDYGFIYNAADNIGYLTSTRNGGRGNEDIWMVSKIIKDNALTARSGPKNPIARDANPRAAEYSTPGDIAPVIAEKSTDQLHLLVTDQRGLPLSGAEVDLTDCFQTKGATAGDGKFYFDKLIRQIDCSVTIRKKGYRDTSIDLKDFGQQNVRVALGNDKREEFRGFVYDARTQKPINGATVQLEMEEGEIDTKTDETGYYALNVEPGMTYLITYNKYGYTDAVVRTNFPVNSNNRIANVTLESKYNDKQDDYVAYGNATKTTAKDPTSQITRVYPRETPKAPVQEKPNGYSIQLASLPEAPSDARLSLYDPLLKLGNLYVKAEDNSNKIRLGIFPTLAEASANLKIVLQEKIYQGSWVVEERNADESLILGNENLAPVQHNAIVEKGPNAEIRYGIQLGSFAAGKAIPINEYYKKLDGVGTLYSTVENGYTKVRMGIWENHADAEQAKKEAIRRGYPDAIIITEHADDPNLKDVLDTSNEPKNLSPKSSDKLREKGIESPTPVVYSEISAPENPYFIRIAALSKPDDFDASPLYGLGTIEKRKSPYNPAMTIILLGSFPDLDAATSMAKRLQGLGYEDAQVVKEEKGKLIRKEK